MSTNIKLLGYNIIGINELEDITGGGSSLKIGMDECEAESEE